MLEILDQIDKTILIALNGNGDPYWDQVMWLFTGRALWIPVVLTYLIYFFRKGGWKEGLFMLLAIALLITLCDQIASGFCKPYFARLRPSQQEELKGVITLVNGYTSGLYGFVSSHASNSIGFAMFSSLVIKNRFYSFSIFTWAIITCYTRVYLGVHFPGDVLAGAFIGIACAYLVYIIYSFIRKHFYLQLGLNQRENPYLYDIPTEVVSTLYSTYIVLMVLPSLLYSFLK